MGRSDQISRRIKLRHLNALVTVIAQGSMVKAAERLSTSQPVVSKTIADLEQLLGVQLFYRSSQGIEPTVWGRALAKRSLAIFDDLMGSINELEVLSDPGAGELRIGCTEEIGATLVPAVINKLSKRHPRMIFDVVLADPTTLLERDLRGRRVDLVLGPFWTDVDRDLDVVPLKRDRLHVVSGLKNPWAKRRKIALQELAKEHWVLPPRSHPIGSLVVTAFQNCGVAPPQTAVTVTSARFTATMVASGQFIGILPSASLSDRHALIKALPVDLPKTEWPASAVMLKNRSLGPTAALFLDAAREFVKATPKRRGSD